MGALLTACASESVETRAPGRQTRLSLAEARLFAPGVASTPFSEARLSISPDGRTALFFSRNRPGGLGGYDIWSVHRTPQGWSEPVLASFNWSGRDFDPAFTADGDYVYFCSDRPGGYGGDDLYRIRYLAGVFGEAENLGPAINSAGDEYSPMLSPDGGTLLFASNGRGGAGRFDLFLARRTGDGFVAAAPAPGSINTADDEFDATFLHNGVSIVFARAPDLTRDRVDLYFADLGPRGYGSGDRLPLSVNTIESDTYAPMLDWSHPGRFTFTGARAGGAGGMDLYLVAYTIEESAQRRPRRLHQERGR